MLRSLGDDYGAVLRAHRAILREAVQRHGGVELGTEGDACFLAFPGADGALAAAAEAQHALAAADDDTTRVAKTLNALGAVAVSQGTAPRPGGAGTRR